MEGQHLVAMRGGLFGSSARGMVGSCERIGLQTTDLGGNRCSSVL
jgi:hypothetical protein